MAILSLTGGAASVPNASTTTAGKVRLATVTEATTGTSATIAVTPAGLSAAIAGIAGGMTYKGFWDALNAVPDLSDAEQGDFYYVSAAGTRYGKSWSVGDHLVINEDMGGTIDPLKIDKIDSTESIVNLGDLADVDAPAPSTGEVLRWNGTKWADHALVAADVSGVATSAALSAEESARIGADNTLQDNIDAEASARASGDSALQTELNTTQTGAGLNTNGSYTAPVGSNYLGSSTSLKGADTLLDTQLKTATDKGNALQAELDSTQAGAGLGTGGAYTAPTSSNYLSGATSLKGADSLLDSEIKSLSDTVATLGGASVVSVNTITPVEGNVTLGGADIDAAHSATNYTAATADIDAHLTGIDSAIGAKASQVEVNATQAGAGLGTDGAYTAPVGSNYLSGATSLKNADSLLDSALKAEETARISAVSAEASTRANADSALQTELNATQAGAGLGTDGAYTAPTSSNYLGGATSLKGADSLLDSEIKSLADTVAALGGGTVVSVNGVLPVDGDVTITATDLTGFATVATSGAYADLTGTPTLAAVATSGDYADLTGSPVLATVATSGLYSDLTGTPSLATVATSGLYSDLTGSPVLATVATSGAYSDLTGTPALAAVATSGEAGDVSVAATPTNYTATTADVEAHLSGIDAALGTLGGELVTSVNSVEPVLGNVTLNAVDIDSGFSPTAYAAPSIDLDGHLSGINTSLGNLFSSAEQRLYANTVYVNAGTDDVQDGIDAVTVGNQLVWVSTGGYSGSTVLLDNKNLIKVRAEGCGTGAFGIVELESRGLTISGAESTRNLVQGFQVEGLTTINGTLGRHAFIDCQLIGGLTITNGTQNFVTVRDCDLTGTLTIGADVTATVYLVQCNLTGLTISNSAGAARLIIANCSGVPLSALTAATVAGQSGFADGSFRTVLSTATLPNALSFTGRTSELTNNANFITAAQAPVQSVNTLTGAITLNGANLTSANTPVNYTAATSALNSHLSGIDTVLGTLGGATVVSVNGVAPVLGDVTVTGQVIDTNHTETNYTAAGNTLTQHFAGVDAALGLRPLTTATLLKADNLSGLASTTTARTNLGLGSAATKTAGSAIGNVLEVADVGGSPALPALDASLLTGLSYANLTNVPTSFITDLTFITDQNPLTLVAGKHYVISTATATTKTLTVPTNSADVANGDYIRITNWGLGRLKLTTGGGNTCYLLSGQDVVGGATAGELFIESKCTVDLIGFNYVAGDLLPAWGAYFISSIEINTRSFTTTGQAVIYNNTTKKLESGSADSFALSYSPTNYTTVDSLIGSHLAGVDTELGSLDSALTTLDGLAVKSVNGLTPTAGAVTLGGADIDTAHSATNYTAATADIDAHLAGVDTELGLKAVLADGLSQFEVDLVTVPPTDGQTLLWDADSSKFLPADPPAPVASTTQRGLVELATDAEATAGTSTSVVLTPSNLAAVPTGLLDNSAGTLLEAANNLSDLGSVSTARTNLGLGTAAVANTGTSAGNVVVLSDVGGVVKLPAVDGSLLTNVFAAPPTYESKSANFTAAVDYHYSVSATSANITCTLPARSGVALGKQIRFKLYDATNDLILTPAGSDTIDGLASYTLGNPKQSITLVRGANDWEIL